MKVRIASYGFLFCIIMCFLFSACTSPSLLWSAAVLQAEENELKTRMNNRYVDSEYAGWNETTMFDTFCFCLPPEWTIEKIDDNTVELIVGSHIIGIAGLISEDSYRDVIELYESSACCFAEGDIRDAEMKGMYGNGCNFFVSSIQHNKELLIYYEVQTFEAQCNCAIIFPADLGNEKLQEIVEAVAYSYWKVEAKNAEREGTQGPSKTTEKVSE